MQAPSADALARAEREAEAFLERIDFEYDSYMEEEGLFTLHAPGKDHDGLQLRLHSGDETITMWFRLGEPEYTAQLNPARRTSVIWVDETIVARRVGDRDTTLVPFDEDEFTFALRYASLFSYVLQRDNRVDVNIDLSRLGFPRGNDDDAHDDAGATTGREMVQAGKTT